MRFYFFLLLLPFWSSAQVPNAAVETVAPIDSSNVSDSLFYEFIPYQHNGTWCLYNVTQNCPDTSYHFDTWLPSKNSSWQYIFRKDGKYGAVSDFGEEVYPFVYDSMQYLTNGIAGLKDGRWNLINSSLNFNSAEGTSESEDYQLLLDSIRSHNGFDYLYNDGKVGIYYQGALIIPIEFEAVQPLFFNELFSKQQYAILAFDGAKYRFFDLEGKDLLGVATSDFQLMHHDFLKYWDSEWKYYNFHTKNAFSSNGNDVVLYNQDSYKVYSKNHQNPTFFNKGKVFRGAEDYFLLPRVYTDGVQLSLVNLGFRKGGKVGVMDTNGVAIVPALFDRVEEINDMYGHFKFFEGDSCGLVSKNGVIGFAAKYSNIIATKSPNRFIVIKDKQTGVVDQRGKIIVPLKYDYIQDESGYFLLRNNDRIGLASDVGKIIYEPMFKGYRSYSEDQGLDFFVLIFEKNTGELVLTSKTEMLSSAPFNSYNYGNGVFKLYRPKTIEVVTLDEKAKVEDRIFYDNVQSMRVNKFDEVVKYFGLGHWPISYLEENQKNGLFGLRYFQKSSLSVEPTYNYVQMNNLSSYFGEKESNLSEVKLTDDLSVLQRHAFDQLYLSSGKVENEDLLTAESILYNRCWQSTGDALVFDENLIGSVEMYSQIFTPFSLVELSSMDLNFGFRYDNSTPKKYVFNSKPIICSIQEAEMSLFEYYSYYANLGGLQLSKETAAKIMNPNLGIRFDGGKRGISNKRYSDNSIATIELSPHKDFSDFHFSENLNFLITKDDEKEMPWKVRDFKWEKSKGALDSKDCFSFSNTSGEITLLELEEKVSCTRKVNIDFPNFHFREVDSLEGEYFVGRLILGDEKQKRMIDPSGKVYLKNQEDIKYLGESYFARKDSLGWQVLDRNAAPVMSRRFGWIGSVAEGVFGAGNDLQSGIYKMDGSAVVESESRLDQVTENKYRVSAAPEIWYDVETQVSDTVKADETYLGANFFLSKNDQGDYLLRRFGDWNSIELDADTKPRLYQKHVIFSKKKHLYVCDSEGRIQKFKKAGSPKELGSFTTILGKKERILLDESGREIGRTDLNANVSSAQNAVLVSTSDTNYLILKSGQTSSYPITIIAVEDDVADDLSVFYQDGFYGIKQGENILLEAKFNYLSPLGDRDFRYSDDREFNLYDTQLEKVNKVPYSEYYFISTDYLAIQLNQNWYFYRFTIDGWELLF